MQVDFIVNRFFNSRTYILFDDSDIVWLVDCGDIEKVIEKIGNKQIVGVLLTHTHSDHIFGLFELVNKFPKALIYTNEFGYMALASPKLNLSKYHYECDDIIFDDRKNVRLIGNSSSLNVLDENVTIIDTPGHDPSCMTYKIGNYLFTGDSYIPGQNVVVSFPHSNKRLAIDSELYIRKLTDSVIMPGHDIS